ncbi:MAG: SDR family NAD(P)-dependent oxidoreductase, partial [Dehalococcoidia bacterium]|nr:SDR family NAD(P)-dependent oxidoreductase [Dehalococcoidia bacterium]
MGIPVLSLEGKVAVITGSSQGIGKALALGFAEAGASVVLAARGITELEATAQEIAAQGGKALAVPTDVTNSAQVSEMVQSAVKEFGRVDVLVNCAGGAGRRPMIPLLDMSEEAWDAILALNLKGVYLCCRAAGRVMVEQKS